MGMNIRSVVSLLSQNQVKIAVVYIVLVKKAIWPILYKRSEYHTIFLDMLLIGRYSDIIRAWLPLILVCEGLQTLVKNKCVRHKVTET